MTICNSIGAKVTSEQASEIFGILDRVAYTPKQSITWGKGDFAKVRKLTADLAGYRPSGSCMACHFKALNILREAMHLPPIGGEASDGLRDRRLAICRGVSGDGSDACPAYHSLTDSCGRLVLDAFVPETVTMHDGRTVNPCGCFLPLKASIKWEKCPANNWPAR